MKSSLGKVSYISAATLAKALVGLIISLIALTSLEHDASAEVFQLLVLQSTIITMVSGSAYARGVSIEGDLRHGAGLVLALVVMIAAVSALAISAAIVCWLAHRSGHSPRQRPTSPSWPLAPLQRPCIPFCKAC